MLAYFVAAVSPNMDVANSALPAYVVSLLFFVGLLIRHEDQPDYWSWYAPPGLDRKMDLLDVVEHLLPSMCRCPCCTCVGIGSSGAGDPFVVPVLPGILACPLQWSGRG